MEYQAPYGAADVDQAYVDGNPATGTEGSIVPAKAIEHPQREIHNLIDYSDMTPDEGDLTQLTKAVRSQYINFATDTGSANAIAIAFDPALNAYKQGLVVRVLVAYDNTGATTININGLGARSIRRANGAELVAGDLKAGGVFTLVDDGTRFQVVNYLGAVAGTTNLTYVYIPYAEDSSVSTNLIQVTYSDYPPTDRDPRVPYTGEVILVKVANRNTGAVSIEVNGTTAVPVRRTDGQPLQINDLVVAEAILLEYHTTYWQMMRLVGSQVMMKLNADLTLYVRTDGNDANDGSANDAAHAFLTVQGAINFIKNSFYIAGRNVTIQLGQTGTYYGVIDIYDMNVGGLTIYGNSGNRTGYILSNSGTAGVNLINVRNSVVTVGGLTLYNNNNNTRTVRASGATITFQYARFDGVGTSTSPAADLEVFESRVYLATEIDFWRNVPICIGASASSITPATGNNVYTMNGNTWGASGAFLVCVALSLVSMPKYTASVEGYVTWSGVAYGRRYISNLNSVIYTAGAGADWLPGNAAGETDGTGVYS